MPTELNPNIPVMPTTPPPEAPAPQPEVLTKEYVDSLKELVETQTAQIAELSSTIAAAAAPDPEPPLKPEDDPDNKPFQSPKELRDELKRTSAEITRSEIERIEAERARLVTEDQKKRSDLDLEFDAMLSDAQEQGLIPAIADLNASDDPGKKARRELFAYAAFVGTSNLVAAAKTMKSARDGGLEFDMATGQFVRPAGSYQPRPAAPVGTSSGRTAAPSGNKPSYKDIHTKSIDKLLAEYS